VSFAAITLCVASQRVFIVVGSVYFVIDSVRKLLDTPSYSFRINLKEFKCQGVDWIPEIQDRVKGRELVNKIMSIRIP
jgi:hypothetical protein